MKLVKPITIALAAIMLALSPGSANAGVCDFPGSQLSLAELKYCVDLSAGRVESARRVLQILGDSTTQEVQFSPADEARKAAQHYRDPGATDLCPPPHHMTAMDGCQPK